MKRNGLLLLALCGALSVACNNDETTPAGDGGSDGGNAYPTVQCGASSITSAHCVEIPAGDVAALLNAANTIAADTTIVLAKGTYAMTNQLTIRTNGAHLIGQGIDQTILEFKSATAQVNGVDAISNGFLVQDFTVSNSKKDGVRVEASDGVTFRRIKATWDAPLSSNGAYGIYPVKSKNILVENSIAQNAADAGLYVGQCQHAIVRNNEVFGNVAGLEIENTEYADVYGNNAHDNTGGLVVFDLPGNPIIGRDVRIYQNNIHDNNGDNFAVAGSTVSSIPSGTGTFAMASRRTEISNNTYANNGTMDIAIVSGLVIEQDSSKWVLDTTTLTGDFQDLITNGELVVIDATHVANFRSVNVVMSGNTHTGSGTNVGGGQFGLVINALYKGGTVDPDLYDMIGETDNTTNLNHICFGAEGTGTTVGVLDLAAFPASVLTQLTTPPFSPYSCTTLEGPAITPVVLPATQP